ncbi:MAG: hypothetical protein WBP22_05935 [Candidatus Saccharimonas sp.]
MQHLGLLSFLLLVVGLLITALKLPGGLSKTFSQRVANSKIAEVLYSLLFILTLPLLYLFFAEWFVPSLGMPRHFLFFAAVAVIFQIVCTWMPERGGTMTTIHRVLTGISGIALLPMVFIIATTQSTSAYLMIVSWIALIGMLTLLAVALLNQKGFKYALLLQVGYYALFFAVILLVTYIR